MHIQARDFTLFVKRILQSYFINKRVLDVGSGDINGNNRFLFENCEYHGNDVIQAQNVTIVSKTKDLPFEDNYFDTIISTECFEHDPEYKDSLNKIYNMLKPGGLFCFSCASTGRPEHGTRRTSPSDSYGTIGNIDNMIDYYKNLTEQDLNEVLNLNDMFSGWDTYYNHYSGDLYFVGIKPDKFIDLPVFFEKYVENYVKNTSNLVKRYLPQTLPNQLESLETLFIKYESDKNANFHNYTRQYDQLLRHYRNDKLKYLELGINYTESIKAMRESFKNAESIVGLFTESGCKQNEDTKNNLFIEIGNATDVDFIRTITEKYGTFDIILDDGSHINRDVIKSFELLFPLLNDNGLYIIEDTICYKSDNHIDNNYENHLKYFFNYISFLNQWRHDSSEGLKDHCTDPFKIIKKTDNVFEYSIDKIEYGCSYIAISKKIRKHWIK
jgi:SAM-dependent methyltransferase